MTNHDEIQSLLAGYALGILDEQEKKLVEEHLPGCPTCQSDLAPLQSVSDDLAFSIEPAPLPVGHLERFRAKARAGIEPETTTTAQPDSAPVQPVSGESEFEQARRRREQQRQGQKRGGWLSGWRVASAAAVAMFAIAALFGYLLLDTNSRLNSQEANARALAQLLTSPNLKVTELQPTNTGQKSTARLLSDSATNQALLVSQDLEALPSDKAYQVWLIGTDGKPQSAAVFARTDKSQPAVVALAPPGQVNQYKVVAITVEKSGGSNTGPTTQPFTAGQIN
jgi:anti-sigma-K factor RskA